MWDKLRDLNKEFKDIREHTQKSKKFQKQYFQ